MKYPKEKVDYIVKEYKKGRTQKDIAEELGTYNTTIRRILKREDVEVLGNDKQQTVVSHNPFLDLNDDETLYWLGYLISDGNVSTSRNRINISSNKDPEHLKKYIKFLKSPVKLNKYLNKKYNCYEYSVNFANKEVKEYLISLGITPKKSLDIVINFPVSYSLLRGLIDGDGYVRKYSETYSTIELASGSLDFLNQIKQFLDSEDIYSYIKQLKPNLWSLVISYKEDVKKLANNLYNNASVYLERKKQNIGSALWKHNV